MTDHKRADSEQVTSTPSGDPEHCYARLGPDAVVTPTWTEFVELAGARRVIPICRRMMCDDLTPIGLYQALAGGRPGTFLLESAEQGGVWTRYSFVGVRSAAMLTTRAGDGRWLGQTPVGLAQTGDPTKMLAQALEVLHTPRLPGLPPLTGGLVGMVGYDAVRRWEGVPDANPDELDLPELAMFLATDLAVLDHHQGTVTLIANAINYDDQPSGVEDAYQDGLARLDRMVADLARPRQPMVVTCDAQAPADFASRTSPADYQAAVEVAKEHIRAGDAFQIVVSQRFSSPTQADPLDVYRVLRATNPSPYMYLLRFPDPAGDTGGSTGDLGVEVAFSVVGSSPEALVRLTDGEAMLHPIAGTRPRGSTPERDAALAEELLADAKERAEHLMLVDLGRNDLGRVCDPGTVEVIDFMTVERYSHVMHIVSTVVGRLASHHSATDLLAATFPAGTLSGAPKPRAMEIIDALEPVRRGLYAGVVGYLDFAGDMDTAIAIRTAVLRDGQAHVQAGAGIVADSDPVAEHEECCHKAMAVLRAIAVADTMRALR
jgi:anthranilate synthase component 1